jgi:hypothetical protein
MGGELSFCINDLASYRGNLTKVARLVLWNYRGATFRRGLDQKNHWLTGAYGCLRL